MPYPDRQNCWPTELDEATPLISKACYRLAKRLLGVVLGLCLVALVVTILCKHCC